MKVFLGKKRILPIFAVGVIGFMGATVFPGGARAQDSNVCVNCAKGCCEVTTTECSFGETDPTKCKSVTDFACCKLSATGGQAAAQLGLQPSTLDPGEAQPPPTPPQKNLFRFNTPEPVLRR